LLAKTADTFITSFCLKRLEMLDLHVLWLTDYFIDEQEMGEK